MTQYTRYPVASGGGGGSGTVTHVGLSLPDIFIVSGSPVTTTGTLTGTLNTQVANRVLAGPTTGADDVPTFRNLVAADIPTLTPASILGNPNTLAWFSGTGELANLSEWSVNAEHGILLQLSSAVASDLTLLQLASNNTVGGNYQGLFVNSDNTVTGSSTLINTQNLNAVTGNLVMYSSNVPGSASVGNDFRHMQLGNDAAVANNGAGILINQNGTIAKSWTSFGANLNANVGDGSGNSAIGLDLSFQGHAIDGQIFGVNFNNSCTTSTNNGFMGVNLNNSAALGGSATGFNFSNSGALGGTNNLNGFYVNNTANGYNLTGFTVLNDHPMVEGFHGLSVFHNASARTITGADIQLQGAITDDANGLRITMNNVTSASSGVTGLNVQLGNATDANPQGVVGISSDARIQVNSTTQLRAAQGFQIGNRVAVAYTIPAGSPVTGTDSLGNNFAGDLLAQDDLSNGGFGIGWNSVGFIGTVAVAATKTIQSATAFLPAFSFPDPGFATGGAITDLHMIRLFAPLFSGGTAVITNLYGIKIDPSFATYGSVSTNPWGIWVGDDTANNWFAKNVVIGGSTGLPEVGQALDVTGAVRLRALSTAGLVTTDASGHVSSVANASTELNYTPGTPGNWAGAAPTTVQQALDRIAAVVSLGGGTPIP